MTLPFNEEPRDIIEELELKPPARKQEYFEKKANLMKYRINHLNKLLRKKKLSGNEISNALNKADEIYNNLTNRKLIKYFDDITKQKLHQLVLLLQKHKL